jgi:hypothetical protein
VRRFVPLKRTVLTGDVAGPLASLRLTQVFGFPTLAPGDWEHVCPSAGVVEALFRFPLPGDAAVTGVRVRFGEVEIRAELKARGIDDYYIVAEEGDYQWALSLGVFRSEEAAKARLGAVQALGVRSARVTPRETPAYKIWLQVKGVDAPLEARLKDIARQIEGTELRKCL